ncbi:MAG: hypothetical protein FWC91_11815 [Defluviitaleaceae bacterium]|nr:hypothetical protein [Defluviitaleaceae bacterium]
MGFQTLNVAITGMRAAQTGLAVTGHNMANAEIAGFSRQRTVQHELPTRGIGTNRAGQMLHVGTGVDNSAVHQIRSRYFDLRYREHNARLSFYAQMSAIGHHLETVLGELDGSYRMQAVLADMWNAIQELNTAPANIEARDMFIGSAIAFMDKAQNIFDELFELQRNLDSQVRSMVSEINDIVERINILNVEIQANEFAGDNANDMRDERNRLIDRLSGLVPIDVFENPDTGRIDILTINGNFFLHQGSVNTLGLKWISGRYDIVEPVFTSSPDILVSNTPPREYTPFYNWNRPINSENGNAEGALMALLRARGAMPATYRGIDALWNPIALPQGMAFANAQEMFEFMIINSPDNNFAAMPAAGTQEMLEWESLINNLERLYPQAVPPGNWGAVQAALNAGSPPPINADTLLFREMNDNFLAARRTYRQAAWSKEHALVPRLMKEMDQVVNSVVRLLNNAFAPVDANGEPCPDAPFDLNRDRLHTELFVRRDHPRFNGDDIHNPGFAGDFDSLYTTRNLMVNPLLLQDGGYSLLALSLSGDPNDVRLMQEIIARWGDDNGDYSIEIGGNRYNLTRAYEIFITNLGVELRAINTSLEAQFQQVVYADNRRNAIMGVSMDEEVSNMMTFQFAYQAAARLFNIIDGMIDTIVNRMGRAGL